MSLADFRAVMADDLFITVNYNGAEKRVGLVVRPSLELSDYQVDMAETKLHGHLRDLFQIPLHEDFYLHEAETARIMSKESFREPAYTKLFPRHWYLVKPHRLESVDSNRELANRLSWSLKDGPTGGSSNLIRSFDMTTPPSDDTSSEASLYGDDESLLPLSDLTALPEAQYRKSVLKCSSLGQFGFSLRHFSIQSDHAQRSDTPLSDLTHPRSDSRTSNDSMEPLKLSTTFVHKVTPGSVAEQAGLEIGLFVHMINGTSILSSSGPDIRELIAQCGDELTLLTLSKEHDDLQFLYPRYTYGQTGEYSTKDGLVATCDIPVSSPKQTGKQNSSKVAYEMLSPHKASPVTNNSNMSPPTGLVYFNDGDDASQDNSQLLENQRRLLLDEVLVGGSLCDIESRQQESSLHGDMSVQIKPSKQFSYYHSSRTSGLSAMEFTHRELDLINEGAATGAVESTSEWYNDSGDEFPLGQDTSSVQIVTKADVSSLLSPTLLSAKVRTRSNSSLEARTDTYQKGSQGNSSCLSGSLTGRVALTSSMSALDHLSRHSSSYHGRARSTDLGRVKLKKKGNKSLEGLTRIASDGFQHKIRPGDKEQVQLTRRRSIDNTLPKTEKEASWVEQSADFTIPPRGVTSSDMSQGSKGQLSYEEQRGLSYDSTGSTSKLRQDPTPKSKRSSRGYQSRRAELYKSRSKVTVSESVESDGPNSKHPSGGRGRHGQALSPPTSQDNEIPSSSQSGNSGSIQSISTTPLTPASEPPRILLSEPKAQLSLGNAKLPLSREDNDRVSKLSPPIRSIDRVQGQSEQKQFLHQPFISEPRAKIPIFKTRSIGAQVVREVNIEDAIEFARSQATQGDAIDQPSVSQGARISSFSSSRRHSVDTTLLNTTGNRRTNKRMFERGQEVIVNGSADPPQGISDMSPVHLLSGEMFNVGSPSSHTLQQTNIQCHGVLNKKQDILNSGKRAQDRTWKSFYAVLASDQITFYKDRKEARLHNPCDEPPVSVVPSNTVYANNYSKKKFVFKVVTKQGSVFLLQAADAPSVKNWVNTIQALNGGPPEIITPKDSSGKLASLSPLMGRRPVSPGRHGKKKDEGSKGKFLERLKKTLTRQRGDEPDFSSFVTFSQPLEICPVSLDHKRVPLAVEYCVHTVEELGLNVEGIYRKPGQTAMINYMSNMMDKGTYEFTEDEIGDVHTVASLCKKFFKELPDPMIPGSLHNQFLACARCANDETRLNVLKDLVFQLPIAHYHTLKYLMNHLKKVSTHSEQNKMTFRNVALVFGPTLMRSTAVGHDMLASMNEGYTIVELLCSHVDYLFQSELCAEEEKIVEEIPAQDEDIATRGSPALRRKSEETSSSKDVALSKVSPQSARRINNAVRDVTRVQSTEPKHSNSDSSGPYTSQVVNPRRNRPHVYEDVERTSRPHVRHAYEDVEGMTGREPTSRTSNWVNKHSEIGWGQQAACSGRELTGSMWAARNRSHKEKRDRTTRRFSIDSSSPHSQPDRETDLTMTYHESSGSRPSDHRSVNLPVNYSTPSRMSNTLPGTAGGIKRRVSYLSALQSPGEERSTEKRHSEQSGNTSQFTSHRYSHSSTHKQLRPREQNSLAQSSGQPPLVHQRKSETTGPRSDGYNQCQDVTSLSFQPRTKPAYPHCTLNTGGRPSPSEGGLHRTLSAQQPESYFKQSLL